MNDLVAVAAVCIGWGVAFWALAVDFLEWRQGMDGMDSMDGMDWMDSSDGRDR